MKNHKSFEEIWDQVPPDYYQEGIKKNILQRLWHRNKLNNVVSAIKLKYINPLNILDVGSASGWFLSELKKEFKNSECVGIDTHKAAINYGKKKYKNIKLVRADAHKIPFKENTFEVIVCCEVLEHVEEPEVVIKEMKRVLKRNGRLIIEIDTGNWLFKLIWYFWTNLRKGVWRDSHIHSFSVEKLKRLFVKNGLKIKEMKIFNLSMAVVFVLEKN